jgi:RNA polymerase sigma-70 factor (ECF subfamily)
MKDMRLLTDEELVNGFVSGNEECIDVLIERHKQKLFSYILINVKQRDLAEDIFQETFFRVIQSLNQGRYFETGKFCSWAMRIAHNLIIDYFRRQKNIKTVSGDENDFLLQNSVAFAEKPQEDKLAYDQVLKDVAVLVEMLPPIQRQVVFMRHYQGLSFKEIAEETNVSINTALGRMRYAIINLRKLVDEHKISLTV